MVSVNVTRTRLPLPGALGVGVAAIALATVAGLPARHGGRALPALLLVLPVLLTSVVGGTFASLIVAGLAALTMAIVFLPPVGSPAIELSEDLVAVLVFVVVAVAGSTLVGLVIDAERRRIAADEVRLTALESLDTNRRELLRAVSHELRSPLGVVHAAASDLLAPEAGYDEVTTRRLTQLVLTETSRLERIVTNLLAMSRIEGGVWQPAAHPLDVADVLSSIARRMAETLDRRITVSVPERLPSVVADPVQLDLVVSNLLENASRHAPADRPIELSAGPADDAVRITVRDHGRGLDKAVADRLFEPFVTGSGSTSTGIGLAVCRAIVVAHGGTIGAHGASGGGTAVTFILPTAGPTAHRAP